MIDDVVSELLEAVPEFADRFLELVADADDDPGTAAALTELAEYAAGLALDLERSRPVLVRCLEAVESAARRSDEAAELVAWAFLDSLAPADRARLAPWFGARTRALLDEVEGPGDPGP